ncbi:MAG: hypothetical protein JEZ10_02445 [Verrucomicrobia bacterium]|nr:hypothetical protein [Verrucomicrobiota bacterium]
MFGKFIPVMMIGCALSGAAQAITIWSEDFSSYVDAGITGAGNSGGYPGSVTKWSIDVSNCTLSDAADYFMAVDTSGGRMEAVDIDGEAVWTSELIDISAYTNISLSVDTSENGSSTSGSKYVRLFYKLNGGTETAFSVNPTNSGNWGAATAAQSNLYGSTVQIITRANNPNASDASIFDNVSVSGDSTAANLPPALDPVGDKNVMEQGTLEFTVTASDPIDGDAITLSATNLPTGATFSTNGLFNWNNAVPAGAYDVTFYAADKDGDDSETITITVSERPKLLISEIADPAGTGEDVYRFVELYNAGTNTLDLAAGEWFLSKQVNGGTWYDIPLAGPVSSASAWVIAYSATDFQDAYGFAPDQESGTVSGNGDDAYFLYFGGNHTNGILIDVYGELDTDGTDTTWDYEDSCATRNNNILAPNNVWTASEWTITAGAMTDDMTPGEHGPRPEFQGLGNQFVFLGDDLTLPVTAVNTVRTDVITLSATTLPAGATFPISIGTNTVESTLNWNGPAAGVYTATFSAAGESGTTTESISITVSSTSQIDGKFYGWDPDTIVKLRNGQFWRNTGGVGATLEPPLRNPDVSVTNPFGTRRMTVEEVSGYTTVERIDSIERSVTCAFSGLHDGNIYELADGTVWEQTDFENIPSAADPVTAWRWVEGGKTWMRFIDREDIVIGTCEVIASAVPTNSTITSSIDGWFRGLKNKRVFALSNGQFWQQLDLDSSTETIYGPVVTITNWLQSGIWRMSVQGVTSPAYVEVHQLTNVTHTAISGWFHGFGLRNIFRLQNGSWWRQTSLDNSTSTRFGPEVLIWNDNGTDILEMPDEGRSVSAEELTVHLESSITNKFSGLHYGNLYRLNGNGDWLQISFENVITNVSNPSVMLWIEGAQTNMVVRGDSDVTIGSCTVVDPVGDADGDQISNAAEMTAGTNLFDKESKFEVTETTRDGTSQTVLHWDAVEGRVYSIEWTPSLTESFQPLENKIAAPQNSWTNTVHSVETKGFYRIGVRLAD